MDFLQPVAVGAPLDQLRGVMVEVGRGEPELEIAVLENHADALAVVGEAWRGDPGHGDEAVHRLEPRAQIAAAVADDEGRTDRPADPRGGGLEQALDEVQVVHEAR
jgi:hypothetical protein